MDSGDCDVEGVLRGLPGHGSAFHEPGGELARGVRDPEPRNSPQEGCPLLRRLLVAPGRLTGHEL